MESTTQFAPNLPTSAVKATRLVSLTVRCVFPPASRGVVTYTQQLTCMSLNMFPRPASAPSVFSVDFLPHLPIFPMICSKPSFIASVHFARGMVLFSLKQRLDPFYISRSVKPQVVVSQFSLTHGCCSHYPAERLP